MSAHSLPDSPRRWLVPTGIGLAILAADRITKRWVIDTLGPTPGARELALAGDWLALVYGHNTGVAFGLFQDMPRLFTVTSIAITAGAAYAYVAHLPNRSPWVQVAMGLILGGAFGNIIDRLRYGHVVDFIRVGWWPVFNLADSAISVGVTMLAGYLIFVGDDPQPAPRTPPRDDGLLRELLSRDLE
ncbi:MAG: signal peptidase II [Chloroflexi bacterium OHK40]